MRANDVHANDFVVLLVRHHLHEAKRVIEDLGLTHRLERKNAHGDVLATLTSGLLGKPDRSHFRMGVGARGDLVVVDGFGAAAGGVLGGATIPSWGRQVRKHRTRHDVADGVEARLGSLHARIDLNNAPLRDGRDGFEPEIVRVGRAADGDE